MKTFHCIYCRNEYPIEDASESDIIPFAFIGGKKLLLKNRVCESCNGLVNRIAEQCVIREFESLRRRIDVKKRRGSEIRNQYIIKYQNDSISLETNAIKSDDPSALLSKPIRFKGHTDKGIMIGPYDKIIDIASKKGHKDRVEQIKLDNTNFSLVETYSVPLRSFFSKEMKTMVAKVCFEWIVKACTELNPLSNEYNCIREAIYTNSVESSNIVDVMSNPNIAKGLFEDIIHLNNKEVNTFVPKKLIVGDYYLFFEIKNNKLYCFFAFMGLVLYRVLVSTENLPDTSKTLMVSLIHKYSGRTGKHDIWTINQDTWAELSFHLSNQDNYNNMESYTDYLKTKIHELIQFQIEE